jgi:hypothetical protein
MVGRIIAGFIIVAGLAATVACDRGSNDAAPPATATGAARSTPISTPVASPSGTAVAAPTTDPLVAAVAQRLRPLALQIADAPSGFTPTSDQPFSKKNATTADITIPPLAIYFDQSDLEGGVARLFTSEQPASALTSVVYLFGTPASAKGLVDTIAALTTDGYYGASSVDRVQSDKIGDAAQMMRYQTTEGQTLEYTWAQGRVAGQIVLRSREPESPDDVALVLALARKQSEHMAANLP